MFKSLAIASLLVTAAASASAQTTDTAPGTSATQTPAPVVRAYQSSSSDTAPPPPAANSGNYPQENPGTRDSRGMVGRRWRQNRQDDGGPMMPPPVQIRDSQPIAGVWLRYHSTSSVKTISATPQGAEVRLESGVLNVNVHQPAQHTAILVDLPGGQTSLLKDGLYTFNAETNTVRVLHGEAAAFPTPTAAVASTPVALNTSREKGIKIKESRQFSFVAAGASGYPKPVEAYAYELGQDLLPANGGDGGQYANVSGDDGPSGYPYYGGGYYPGYWGYGYPYGYGIGIGYYGGFGGYRGGYRGGGFRGGGFRGHR